LAAPSREKAVRFSHNDWTAFRTVEGLQRKAGAPRHKLAAVVVKELARIIHEFFRRSTQLLCSWLIAPDLTQTVTQLNSDRTVMFPGGCETWDKCLE
jgi:hypothetical protein